MDEVAGRSPAPVLQQTATSHIAHNSEVEQDLLGRIRSLLASRNEHNPPRTPLPTPDFTLQSPRPALASTDYFDVAGRLESILVRKLVEAIPSVRTRSRKFRPASHESDSILDQLDVQSQDRTSIASEENLQGMPLSDTGWSKDGSSNHQRPWAARDPSHMLKHHITASVPAPPLLTEPHQNTADQIIPTQHRPQDYLDLPSTNKRVSALDQLHKLVQSAKASIQSYGDRNSSDHEPDRGLQVGAKRLHSPHGAETPQQSSSSRASLEKSVSWIPQPFKAEKYETRFTEKPRSTVSSVGHRGGGYNLPRAEALRQASSSDSIVNGREASTGSQHTVVIRRDRHQDATERFNRAIADVEILLDEALRIARDAAEDDNNHANNTSSPPFHETSLTSGENLACKTLPRESAPRRRQNRVLFVESDIHNRKPRTFKRRDTPYPTGSAGSSRRTSSAATRHLARGKLPYEGSSDELSGSPRSDQGLRSDVDQPTTLQPPNAYIEKSPLCHEPTYATILPLIQVASARTSTERLEDVPPQVQKPKPAAIPLTEKQEHLSREKPTHPELPTRKEVKGYIKVHNEPPIEPRRSSNKPRARDVQEYELTRLAPQPMTSKEDMRSYRGLNDESSCSSRLSPGLDSAYDSQLHHQHFVDFDEIIARGARRQRTAKKARAVNVKLKGHRHVNITGREGFSLSSSCHHQPVARDWCVTRKRWTALIACINTALIGILIGIYAGEVPAIQYAIADVHHYATLGNVFMYVGLAVPTLLFWPLPLLHGRRPYTVTALAIALPLQIPQGIAVGTFRSPDVATYRVLLLLARSLSGLALGFANINSQAILLDLFGASLMGANPHQEIVNEHDVRRHGGGMGLWLGIWSWCFIGSIGVGFLIGALIVGSVNVTWGFWIATFLIICVLFLNVITPEVRRSAYRRTISEIKGSHGKMRRIARGEIKMHLTSRGPLWWGEEVKAGMELCRRMMKQSSFVVLAVYLAWVYAQIILVIMLLGALTSKYYRMRPNLVGLSVVGISIGALVAVPFQMASFFSRARHHPPRTDSMTFQKQITWSSHLVRRSIFMIALPFSGLAYTLSSGGPPLHPALPACFGGLVGFLSSLAIAEGTGIIMKTFDTSDLQPGMTGRPRQIVPARDRKQRTCFSCYPRVSAGLAIVQSLSFLLAAAATGTGGGLERRLGAKEATGVVASILMGLTILLIAVLWRFRTVKVIPNPKFSARSRETTWEPVIIGNPSGTTRRMNLLEMGRQSRWTEIRRRNRLTSLGLA